MSTLHHIHRHLIPMVLAMAAFFGIHGVDAQPVISPVNDATTLADHLVGSESITITNATLTGADGAAGTFTAGTFGIGEGILLTSGVATSAAGPNASGSTSNNRFYPGDADLDDLTGFPTFDACVLEFDFVPDGSTVSFTYIFASEEYNEYVCSYFNDAFAFFIDGPEYENENFALITGTDMPVGINTVNNGEVGINGSLLNCEPDHLANSSFFVDNIAGTQLEYDGYTVPIEFAVEVTPGETYHLKLAIADAADGSFDSGVFLQAQSLISIACEAGTPEVIGHPPAGQLDFTPANLPNPLSVTGGDSGVNDSLIYVLTDSGDNILDVAVDGNFNTLTWDFGTYKVYALSYAQILLGLELGNPISGLDATGCFDLSDPLIVNVVCDFEFGVPAVECATHTPGGGDEYTVTIPYTGTLPGAQLTAGADALCTNGFIEITGDDPATTADGQIVLTTLESPSTSCWSLRVVSDDCGVDQMISGNSPTCDVDPDCPELGLNIGDPCDDGDPTTFDDTVQADCDCEGMSIYDCPGLGANVGDPCDDGDSGTGGDTVNSDCECEGFPIYDCPDLEANIGDSCDDGDPNTHNDTVNAACECIGTHIYDCPDLEANVGDPCDDGDPNTENDAVDSDCECVGIPIASCTADGGLLAFADGSEEMTFCADDGIASTIQLAMAVPPTGDLPHVFVATDPLGNVINYATDQATAETFDVDAWGVGVYWIQVLSYDPSQSNVHDLRDAFQAGIEVNIQEVEGCADISNIIVLYGESCGETGCYAVELIDFVQGLQTNGNPVSADRSDPGTALGEPDRSNSPGGFVSLGVGGHITLAFGGVIYDAPGNDIRIFETSYSGDDCSGPNDEQADIEVSLDGVNWYPVGTVCRDGEVNIASTGLEYVTQIRITNAEATASLDGYDVDGVESIHPCEEWPEPVTIACYADFVVEYIEGLESDGTPLRPERTDPLQALGAPEGTDELVFVSLGYGGSITLGVQGVIFNRPGDDLMIVETTYNNTSCDSYFEYADVYLSADGVSFDFAKTVCRADNMVDISDAGDYDYIRYIKVVNNDSLTTTFDGFDLDGVQAFFNCAAPVPVMPATKAVDTPETSLSAYPNPGVGPVTFTFVVPIEGPTQLELYDANGRLVERLFDATTEGGESHTLSYDARGLPGGVYFCRLISAGGTATTKLFISE